MDGKLDEIIEALITYYRTKKLSETSEQQVA